jgi:hypothetical protein
MADSIMKLKEYLRKVGLHEDLDSFQKAAKYFGLKVMDIKAEEVKGAEKYLGKFH